MTELLYFDDMCFSVWHPYYKLILHLLHPWQRETGHATACRSKSYYHRLRKERGTTNILIYPAILVLADFPLFLYDNVFDTQHKIILLTNCL